MTTLEVVEAVQRSLENEGFLQVIRAQLRSNVLRIISSGPDYTPQVGKAVALTHNKQGTIVLQLVKDLMEEYGLRESLAVFEAEAGFYVQDFLDRDRLLKELNIGSVRNGSILEVLVNDALKGAVTTNIYHNPTPGSAIPGDISLEKTRSPHAQHNQHRQDRSEDEDSISEDGEDDDVNYSQIEEADAPFADSTSSSAAASPAKLTAPAKGETGSESKLYHPDAKASPPALHSIFHQHSNSKMDESSSFEADSPARPVSSHAATTAPPKFAATVLEDSFVEELEEDTSVEEEIAEEQEENDAKLSAVDGSKSTSAPVYPDKIADETKPQFKYAPADSDGDGNMGEGEDGPEYESDRGSEAKDDSQSPIVAASAREGHKPFSDSDSGSDSGRSTRSGGASGSLRPAVADDFDPLDRDTSREGVPAAGHSHHSVAVRRAAAEAAESKNSPDSAPGAKASVFRLGQSSISRSQLGWGSEANNSGLDDRSDENDQDIVHSSGNERRNARGGLSRDPSVSTVGRGARYSNTNQMEAVSFDTDEDEHQPSPVRADNRRSNNQESESDDDTRGRRNDTSGQSEGGGDFQMDSGDDDDDDGDVSFDDDDGALPLVGVGAPARSAFMSSPVSGGADRGAAMEKNEDEEEEEEEEEEYGDDDFVEDDDEDEAVAEEGAQVRGSKGPTGQPSSNTGGLFRSRHDTGAVAAAGRDAAEDSEHSSVEEEIEEEDEMSVGDADSEEDDVFGSPAVSDRKQKTSSAADVGGSGGMFRAGRSGALPVVGSSAKATNFDSILNSFEADSEDDGDGGVSSYLPSAGRATTTQASATRAAPSITSRMREIDSQLEELEQGDPHLAALRGQHSDDDNSVASEDIDAMEFSTGGGPENDSESSGEGSFSFLDSSSKK